MNITILSIQSLPKTTKAGKPYEVLDIAFKNNTFQGKVEGKQLMPFGGNSAGFNALKNAQPGQTYEITVVKNDAGYNDWTAATLSDGTAPAASTPNAKPSAYNAAPASQAGGGRGFPTPEERAATQIYIVRQSSLAQAVGTLAAGAKSALDPTKVIEIAKVYEGYVLGIAEATPDNSGFDNMIDDVPL